MIWYDDLYLSENIEKKADKIMENHAQCRNAALYVISLPQNNDSVWDHQYQRADAAVLSEEKFLWS